MWSIKVNFFYEWKQENLAYKIQSLCEGGDNLNYDIERVVEGR